MRKILTEYKYLLLIILLFSFTRLWQISSNPSSLYWDEASIGYNAYSILLTGKDEWGRSFPIHFRAFGEFKLPVYIYSVVLSEMIFDISELAVRLPSVLYSLGVVILTYLIASRLFSDRLIALISTLSVVIMPWFFIFSRTGYEATAGLMFYLLGLYLFVISLKKKYFFLGTITSFIFSIYSYNSFRIIIPINLIFLIGIYIYYYHIQIRQISAILLLSGVIFLLSLIPIVRLITLDQGGVRLQAIGIFQNYPKKSDQIRVFTVNYLSHFSADFLLENGDRNLRSQVKKQGELFVVQVFFVLLGILYLFKSNRKLAAVFITGALIAPIPAAITIESPHALRSIAIVPFLAILIGCGVKLLTDIAKKYQNATVAFCLGLMLSAFAGYFNHFLNEYPKYASSAWQYEYKQIFTNPSFDKNQNSVISDYMGQPYIFMLFYTKYNPSNFQKNQVRSPLNDWGFSSVSRIENTYFKPIDEN